MSLRGSAVSCLVLAAALTAAPVPASADDGPVYLAAGLRGANEVGVPGDPDGQATVVLRISGDEIAFAARWERLDAPVDVRVAAGGRGAPGEERLRLLTGPLPANVRGVTGTVRAAPGLVAALLADPAAFHAGVRDARGSVRGRLHRLSRAIDLNGVLNGPGQATLAAATTPPEHATWWLRPAGAALAYAASWSGVPGPVTGGLVAREGVTRPASVSLFAGALPENVTGVSGVTPVPPEILRKIATAPARYDAVLRTSGPPVRGRLGGGPVTHPRALTAPVLRGEQIYTCAQQPSGAYAFAQLGVAATLRGGIEHTYVTPGSGPPQWVAPDGSAVRGSVVTRTPNGDGVIPELVLDAAQAGAAGGLLARAVQILRVNTTGGTAPPGPCEPGTEARAPYGADYVFLS
ncbi:DUF3455 domain-containing protein [Nonomuraea wenchangensis]|uniref:DUF3455 domain-containing protein n=1 Tax=Nonomuraea wenchangensis TaxID=568860 RepID=UPI003321C452